ncbi:MAG: hypothetical protein KA911_09020 [Xanthomonadales bacterium]|nr:hypothetical protein [Xanthomonadales bacterium]MBP7418733.1 hypothetical protein [Xanthomonadales bacterium]
MADGTQDHVPLDPADRDFLREVRWRRRVGDDGDSRRRRWILGLLVLAHLAFFLWLRDAMVERGRFAVPGREQVLEVRFYEEEVAPVFEALPGPVAPLVPMPPETVREVVVPAAPLAVPSPPPPAAPTVVDEPTDALAARFIPPEEPPPATLQLFNTDGSIRMSQDVVDASNIPAPRPGFRSPLMDAAKAKPKPPPITYDPTVFARYWAPEGETAVQSAFRRATVSRKFKTPWGSTIQCTWVLVIGGCGWGIAPAPLEKPPPRPGEVYVDEPPKHW